MQKRRLLVSWWTSDAEDESPAGRDNCIAALPRKANCLGLVAGPNTVDDL
jgi:hypothetical protein